MEKGTKEGILQSGPLSCRPFSQCALLLEAIYHSRRSTEEIEWFAGHTRFQELLLLIMRANSSVIQMKGAHEAVQRSIRYMQEHYNHAITVDQLAEVAGITRARYTQIFKEVTGRIPLEHLNGLRIERAQQQLLLTNDRMHDIALSVGYSNEYYFNRLFQKIGGRYARPIQKLPSGRAAGVRSFSGRLPAGSGYYTGGRNILTLSGGSKSICPSSMCLRLIFRLAIGRSSPSTCPN